MLQAIVTHQHLHITVQAQQRKACVHTAVAHKHRHLAAAGNQQRFIAHVERLALG